MKRILFFLSNLFFANHIGPLAIISSILGAVKQSADNLSFSRWKDKNVMKRKIQQRSGDASTAQLAQQRKFAKLVAWSRMVAASLLTGFSQHLTSMTAFNAFIRFNKTAVTDNGTIAAITAADVVVSKGSIPQSSGITQDTNAVDNTIKLIWTDDSNGSTKLATDKLRVVVVSANEDNASFFTPTVARSAGNNTSTVTFDNPGDTVYVYAFFERADGSAVSDSYYLECTLGETP